MDWRQREWIGLLAAAIVFAPGVSALARVWGAVDYYSHGFVVPFVAAWMAWPRLKRLAKSGPGVHGTWAIGLLAGLATYGIGLAARFDSAIGVGMILAAASLVGLRFGRRGVRTLAFPLGFLLFMVPVPPPILNPFIVGLQTLVSEFAVTLVNAFGFDVVRDGNILTLEHGESLFVDEACSGITSIVTLMPLGCVLAYFTEASWVRRLLIVLSVVPIAMLGNLLRVLGTVVHADHVGAEAATQGSLHDLAGVFTFVFACVLLLGAGRLVGTFGPDARA